MRTMKSKDARANWAEILRRAENGEATVIEHYNRPVATIAPYRPRQVRATAHTYNDRTGAVVSIQGVPMADAADYPDHAPSGDAHLSETEGWVLQDRGEDHGMRVAAPTLEAAIMAWADELEYRLREIVIDPIYPPDPDAGPDAW